jgi:hypothetical protein
MSEAILPCEIARSTSACRAGGDEVVGVARDHGVHRVDLLERRRHRLAAG